MLYRLLFYDFLEDDQMCFPTGYFTIVKLLLKIKRKENTIKSAGIVSLIGFVLDRNCVSPFGCGEFVKASNFAIDKLSCSRVQI